MQGHSRLGIQYQERRGRVEVVVGILCAQPACLVVCDSEGARAREGRRQRERARVQEREKERERERAKARARASELSMNISFFSLFYSM